MGKGLYCTTGRLSRGVTGAACRRQERPERDHRFFLGIGPRQ
jgi:hypothetical protein